MCVSISLGSTPAAARSQGERIAKANVAAFTYAATKAGSNNRSLEVPCCSRMASASNCAGVATFGFSRFSGSSPASSARVIEKREVVEMRHALLELRSPALLIVLRPEARGGAGLSMGTPGLPPG